MKKVCIPYEFVPNYIRDNKFHYKNIAYKIVSITKRDTYIEVDYEDL